MTKAQDQRSQSIKEQAYNIDRDKDHKSLTTKAISMNSRRSVTMNSLRERLLASKRRCGGDIFITRDVANSCLGRIMVSLIFLDGLEEEALVEFMAELFEEDEDGKMNEKDFLFNLKVRDQCRKA
nr:hypothetical protein [Tanacetum cinerariifolium]